MSELTKEYLDQKFTEERARTNEKFDDLLLVIKEGFDATASKAELHEVRDELTNKFESKIGGIERRLTGIEFQLNQLAQSVKEFVETVKRQDSEYVILKVKYQELEKRVVYLETRLGGAAA